MKSFVIDKARHFIKEKHNLFFAVLIKNDGINLRSFPLSGISCCSMIDLISDVTLEIPH